jgi:hypothetical protein
MWSTIKTWYNIICLVYCPQVALETTHELVLGRIHYYLYLGLELPQNRCAPKYHRKSINASFATTLLYVHLLLFTCVQISDGYLSRAWFGNVSLQWFTGIQHSSNMSQDNYRCTLQAQETVQLLELIMPVLTSCTSCPSMLMIFRYQRNFWYWCKSSTNRVIITRKVRRNAL